MAYKTQYLSPVGQLTIASDSENITGLWFENQKYFENNLPKETEAKDDLEIFKITRKWLDDYFAGKNPTIKNLPLAPTGTKFQQSVWQILREIPYGKTITYGEIAKKLAEQTNKSTMSARAVGGAVGRNPVSIIVPCHRVLGANHKLTGFSAGIDTKIKLLKHENAI